MQEIDIQITRKLDEKGQSSIEFIMTFAFALGISFLFISQSLNQTIGFVVHYATFMAGRTFLVYDTGSNNLSSVYASARREAQNAFNRYGVTDFDINPQFDVKTSMDNKSLFTGATAKYERLLTPYKLVGGGQKATYFSEGLLGKEPTRRTCYEMTCQAIGFGSCEATYDATLFDNGC